MYDAHPIVDGFPGKTATHGSFGWSSVWLLHDGDSAVLVDTGPPSYVPLIMRGLTAHGLAPADVTDVLLTHSHWDHVGCVSMFPRARRWIGRAEFSWARRQPTDVPFVSQPLLAALGEPESGLRLIDGDGEILPGIRVCTVPGHTPGHVAFLAETTLGPLLFVGDAAKNVRELGARVIDSALDRQVAADSIARINDIASGAGARVVPGHDVLCSLSEEGWRRETAQTAQMQFHHRRDEEPLAIAINDRDPALVSVRSSDAIES